MNAQIKMAVIIAVAIVFATGLYLYFSPFQSCVREAESAFLCARMLGGG